MVSLQPCQLTEPSHCQALVDFAVRTFGRIDVLFNNAAMAYFNWIEDITDEEWDRDRREEVDLVFFLTRAAWPHLKASHGVIVNTASLNGLMSFKNLGSLAHTTAKAVGGRDARQDAVGSSRSAGGSGERGAVPGVRRELVRDRCRHRGRWRHEGLVIHVHC
jgi:NAD(P)-dependent dehydrogenase (short-subunit alcohol dehydrogenase family)